MRVPISWLRDYVDIHMDAASLADRLTMTGTKVEGLVSVGEQLKDIVACKVVELNAHPTSGNLQVAKMCVGKDRPLVQVVTAAKNVAVGDMLPLVLPGGRLADGQAIAEMEFSGVPSQGMLCSARELGIAAQADGILHLDGDIEPGQDVCAHYHLADTVLELEITPNRPDCLCMVGVAREVAAVTGAALRMPDAHFTELGEAAADYVSVSIDSPELCGRYGARLFRLAGVGPSPIIMQARLAAAGVRPINSVVDITNYVMLELNQPLHAFDYERVAGGKIVVRRARPGERLVTLDGVDRALEPDMLVIADAEKAIAVAGVMGGESSEITDATTTVLLEAATFARQSVWRTSRDLKLRTEASSRFEKGLDIESVTMALERSAALFEAAGTGRAFAGAVDCRPAGRERLQIVTTAARIDRIIGAGIDAAEVTNCLVPLGFGVTTSPSGEITVDVPSFRGDVTAEIDLVEEVVRMWGYNSVKPTLPAGAQAGGYSQEYQFAERLRRVLIACGGYEALTFPFISDTDFARLRLAADDRRRQAIRVMNPMVEEQALMRTTMAPAMLTSVRVNMRRGAAGAFLFELGRCYRAGRELAAGATVPRGSTPAEETRVLAGAMAGARELQEWYQRGRDYDFYDAKGALQAIMDELGLDDVAWVPAACAPYHPGRAAQVMVRGECVGYVGQLHPDVAEAYDVPEGTVLFEVDFDRLMALVKADLAYSQLPRFPGVQRDVAIVVDARVPAEEVKHLIESTGGELIEHVRLFDVYAGAQVGEGKKSLAYSVVYRSMQRTLTDDEVNEVHTRVRSALVDRFGAALR